MDMGLRAFLQPDGPGLGRRVVGAGEQGGESDYIDVVGLGPLEGVQILGGGGAGGFGSMSRIRWVWSKVSSSTISSPAREMVRGARRKGPWRSCLAVRSQQLSTMILKLIMAASKSNFENYI